MKKSNSIIGRMIVVCMSFALVFGGVANYIEIQRVS